MISLAETQSEVYSVLTQSDTRCFLRRCTDDNAMWITDFPQRTSQKSSKEAQIVLEASGYTVLSRQQSLWRIDPDADKWKCILQTESELSFDFPKCSEYFPIYELARILLAHPAAFASQPLEDIRLIYKSSVDVSSLIRVAPDLLQRTAVHLRKHEPVAYDSGRLIAWAIADRDCNG